MRARISTRNAIFVLLTVILFAFSNSQTRAQCTASYSITYVDCNTIMVYDSSTVAAGDTIDYVNLTWGDGTSSSGVQPDDFPISHTYSSPGTYTYEHFIVTSLGCVNSITGPVTILSAPIADFTYNSSCNSVVNFTDLSVANSSSIISWLWSFGNGGTSTIPNPTYTFATTGTYNVCLIITNSNGCIDSVCNPVVVTGGLIVADFTFDTACAGLPTQFMDISYTTTPGDSIVSWLWDFGDDHTSTQENPTHIYALAGNYTVTLDVTNTTGHTHSVQKPVSVTPVAVAAFADSTCCTYDVYFTDLSYTPSPNSSIIAWYWEFGDGGTSSLKNPIHTYASYGVYNVTLTVESDVDCSSSTTQAVLVPMAPYADFTYDITPSTYIVHFTDQSLPGQGDIVDWLWYFGDGTSSTFPDPSHEYEEPGIYTVTLVITNSVGTQDIVSKEIELPDISAIDENGNELPSISVYPNPANDHLVVESTEKIEKLRIIDITGNVMQEIRVNNDMIRTPVMDLVNGVYILEVKTAQRYFIKNVIVNH